MPMMAIVEEISKYCEGDEICTESAKHAGAEVGIYRENGGRNQQWHFEHRPAGEVAIFSARQHICYSALYAIARPSVCLSVWPSVRHTGGSVKDG